MNLVIDCGNTRCKWAIFDDNDLVHQHIEDAQLFGLFDYLAQSPAVKFALLSNVKTLNDVILSSLETCVKLLILDHTLQLPFINKYSTPETLGSDRLASVAGAIALHKKEHVLVIDAGTCIKYEVINANGEYLGGAISPGIQMRFNALHHYTEKLPLLDPNKDNVLIGNSTYGSIQSGVMNACLAEVDGMIDKYKEILPAPTVLLTGGDSHFFEGTLKNRIFAVPHLTLIGLNEILRCNE